MFGRHFGKWLPFFVCGLIAACLALGGARDGFAQLVSVGIKAGVPFRQVVQNSGQINLNGGALWTAQVQTPYAIGPVVNVRLPGQYDLELGALYKSIHQQGLNVTLTDVVACIDPPICENSRLTYQTQTVSKVGHSLEFPVTIRYHFSSPSMRPYLEGGYSYNHLQGIFFTSAHVPYNPRAPLPQLAEFPTISNLDRGGFVLGTGAEVKLPSSRIRVTPGIRYTRYVKVQNFLTETNYPALGERPNVWDFTLAFNLNSIFSNRADKTTR
jgi:hypothetical protein